MAEIVRSTDWAASALGPIEAWSASLIAAVEIVLDSPSARLLVWGPEFTTIYNDAYVPVLGAHLNDGTGRSYPDFWPAMWLKISPQMRAAMAGEGQIVTQLRTVRRGDSPDEAAFFRLSFTPVRDQDGVVRGVMQDLVETTSYLKIEHELSSENRRFRELFNQAPVFLLLASLPDFRVQYANAAYETLVGGRQVTGRTVGEVLPEAVAQGFLDLMTEVCVSGKPMIFKDTAFDLSPDAGAPPTRLYLDFIYQPIVDADNRVSGILCVGSDATDGHVAAEQAERLRSELEHGSRLSAMSAMAATLAHELNQPLTAATNYLAVGEMLIETLDSPARAPLKEALVRAGEQVRRAGGIVRSAQCLVEGAPAVRRSVSLSDLIARSVGLAIAADLCGRVNIETCLDLDATEVWVDPVQIEQVLLNLIRNACEAMQSGASQELSISSHLTSDSFAEIVVRDSGTGMSEKCIAAPFDSSKVPGVGGQGIGLSLSRTLVEAHGGRIWAVNNPDGGATFGFTLPLAGEVAVA